MSSHPLLSAVRAARDAIRNPHEVSPHLNLAISLDVLFAAVCQPFSPLAFTDRECPAKQEGLRELVSTRWKELGFYSVGHDDPSDDAGPNLADAIDDLTDILFELDEIEWLFEATSDDVAVSHARSSFKSHWGRHVRNVRWHLFDISVNEAMELPTAHLTRG